MNKRGRQKAKRFSNITGQELKERKGGEKMKNYEEEAA